MLAADPELRDFPVPRNTESQPAAGPLPSQVAARSFSAVDPFHVEVFAAEPTVQNPIDMAWDAQGRIWIAENFTYAERSVRFDLRFRDRVTILEDTTGDGRCDKRTIFADNLQRLTSVQVGHGGVWLMAPPQLLFIPDRNRDNVPDGPAQTVLDGFTVAPQNYHNFANGLRWGPDGWLYGRCGGSCPGRPAPPGTPLEQRPVLNGGIWRYHPVTQQIEVIVHGTTNPWGHDWNAVGDGFFINTVNGHLWQMIPGAHYPRPFTLDPNGRTYEMIEMHADHWHFDTQGKWTGSRDGAANAFGGGHAHTGMMIYLGDNWPDTYRGNLFTVNIHGKRINQEILRRRGSGYVGSHGNDVLISSDPYFRGLQLDYGPDGSVYLLDWSDTGECHEATGVHRTSGRIYRISAKNSRPKFLDEIDQNDLRRLDSRELITLHRRQNAWYARQARLLLHERALAGSKLTEEAQTLRDWVEHEDQVVACRALATLSLIDPHCHPFLLQQLTHRLEDVRALAVRALADHWPIDDVLSRRFVRPEQRERVAQEVAEHLPFLTQVAKSDTSAKVRLAVASTLQRIPPEQRFHLAEALMSRTDDADDHNLPLLVWYGLIPAADYDLMQLAESAAHSTWPRTQRLIARRVGEGYRDHPQALNQLLHHVLTSSREVEQLAILSGIAIGIQGISFPEPPWTWSPVEDSLRQTTSPELKALVTQLAILFDSQDAYDNAAKVVRDDSIDIYLRRSTLEALVQQDHPNLEALCLSLLGDARINLIAAQGLRFSDSPDVGQALVKNYRRFRSPERPQVISLLCSQPSFASELLDAIDKGQIPRQHLTPFDARQIGAMNREQLTARLGNVWGSMNPADHNARSRIDAYRRLIRTSPKKANLQTGKRLFEKQCATCHRLYGQGKSLGPDLTGSQRFDLDYLLENIVTPSAVIDRDYRMSIARLRDGRVVSGLLREQNESSVVIESQSGRQLISRREVENIEPTLLSPMPTGILDQLDEGQVVDLIRFLMHPTRLEPSPN